MSNSKLIYDCFSKINQAEGFDPALYAEEYNDLNSGQKRLRLPVMAQIGWFRLVYPQGRTAVDVKPAGNNVFVARARVYTDYKDHPDHFLAEATASRAYMPDKPTVSPREWAQTAALGIALRNAGFGLQFSAAGASFDDPAAVEEAIEEETPPDGAPQTNMTAAPSPCGTTAESKSILTAEAAPEIPTALPPVPSYEEQVRQAMAHPCPIAKYKGKTLGEVAGIDASAIGWVAKKFPEDDPTGAAARLLCEYAANQSQAAAM